MAKSIHWDSRIGRRVRLRDLHVLFAVAEQGSMAKAGAHLGMSQSAVSQAIAGLEQALGIPLFDRSPRGVELTPYGGALMRRGQAAFDELRAGIRDIEFLADPQVGEVRIACTESIAAGVLPSVIERFSTHYPKVKLHVLHIAPYLTGFAALHERKADVVLTLLTTPFQGELTEHVQAEVLFHDRICLAARTRGAWARRRKLDISDLAHAALISPTADTPGGAAVGEALRAAGLPGSEFTVTTFSVHLRSILAMRGRFIAVLPASVLRFNPGLYALKELQVDLPMPQPPALIVTLKNRTLSPPVKHFIDCARDVARAMHALAPLRRPGSKAARARGRFRAAPPS